VFYIYIKFISLWCFFQASLPTSCITVSSPPHAVPTWSSLISSPEFIWWGCCWVLNSVKSHSLCSLHVSLLTCQHELHATADLYFFSLSQAAVCCTMWGSHSSVSVDSSVLGYCTMCIGKQKNNANYWPAGLHEVFDRCFINYLPVHTT